MKNSAMVFSWVITGLYVLAAVNFALDKNIRLAVYNLAAAVINLSVIL